MVKEMLFVTSYVEPFNMKIIKILGGVFKKFMLEWFFMYKSSFKIFIFITAIAP